MKKMSLQIALLGGAAALFAFGFFSPGIFSESTRVAYVESEEIMKRYYDWQQAQQRIDGAANAWKKELEGMQAALRAKQDSLEKYRLIWSAPEKEAMNHSIADLKTKVQEFWTRKFGPGGTSEYAQLDGEVMKPIYEKVFGAIQEVAKLDGYDYVFDKTGEVLLLYANPAHDLTRDVMSKLGIKDTAGVPARNPFGTQRGQNAPPGQNMPPGQNPRTSTPPDPRATPPGTPDNRPH